MGTNFSNSSPFVILVFTPFRRSQHLALAGRAGYFFYFAAQGFELALEVAGNGVGNKYAAGF